MNETLILRNKVLPPKKAVIDFSNADTLDLFRKDMDYAYVWHDGNPIKGLPVYVSHFWSARRYMMIYNYRCMWDGVPPCGNTEHWTKYFDKTESREMCSESGSVICIPIQVGFSQSKLVCKICDKDL